MADDKSNLANLLETEATGGAPKKASVTELRKNDRNLDLILDIPLKVTVELGRTRMLVSELLNLGLFPDLLGGRSFGYVWVLGI